MLHPGQSELSEAAPSSVASGFSHRSDTNSSSSSLSRSRSRTLTDVPAYDVYHQLGVFDFAVSGQSSEPASLHHHDGDDDDTIDDISDDDHSNEIMAPEIVEEIGRAHV